MVFSTREGKEQVIDSVERQRAHFERISVGYYTARQSRNHILLKELLWAYFFRGKQFLRKEKMSVLEPMCGYGEGKGIVESNLGVSIEYEGFDLSETLLSRVRERDPSIRVHREDVTRWVPLRRYDLVILIGGLHHVPDHAAGVLEKIAGTLGEGGWLVSFEPTSNSSITRGAGRRIYRRHRAFDAETEVRFDLGELNALYRGAGLRIVDQMYPGLLAYCLYYNPDIFPTLNIGREGLTRLLFRLESRLYRSALARRYSFATLTLLAEAGC